MYQSQNYWVHDTVSPKRAFSGKKNPNPSGLNSFTVFSLVPEQFFLLSSGFVRIFITRAVFHQVEMAGKTCSGAKSLDELKKKVGAFPKPKTEELTIEQTKSASLDRAIFDGFASLTSLYISGNEIEEIKDGCFEGLSHLKYLYLNNNNIKKLGIGCFKGLTKISELDLSCNKIAKMPVGCFAEFAMTVNCACLNLSNNLIEDIDIGAFKSLTVLYGSLDLSNNLIKRISTEMFHNLLIEKFDLSNNKIETICENSFFGSNFKFLHLERNCISDVHQAAFTRCEIQQELHMESNKLRAGYDGIFKHHKNLKELYLDDNEITELPSDGFLGLNNLDTLSLNKNDCVLKKDSFMGLDNLETLHLEENGIDAIAPGTFSRLQNLRNLNLSYNNFTELKPNTFWQAANEDQKTYFFTLSLHHNDIEKILPGAFDGIDRIEDLQLYNNKLSKFEPNAWQSLSFIGTIELQNNQISDKTVLYQFLPCRQIKLGGNPLEINVSSMYPNDMHIKDIDTISFNYCCYRLENGKWKFDDRYQEHTIIPK
ncbi:hypothetical protein FQR65_LT06908 [Abscondita terminalis]|nr:hypothetical protein FQR65_LT06908 [Abscondita terminalis]